MAARVTIQDPERAALSGSALVVVERTATAAGGVFAGGVFARGDCNRRYPHSPAEWRAAWWQDQIILRAKIEEFGLAVDD